MTTHVQNTVGKLFLQFFLALMVVIAGLSITNAEAQENTNIEQLFETELQTQVQAYLETHNAQFSETEIRQAMQDNKAAFTYQARNKHRYSEQASRSEETESWPLLSMKVQDKNVDLTVGSRYSR